ncbi:hypothetical protein AB431_17665 [Mycobacterium sp. EPa45]|nr:hypothetical protein AB431_17665 [Mycobacterium sp. EPa45]
MRAAAASLAAELACMAPDSGRNHTLNANALRGYRIADRFGVDREIVTEAMADAAVACGLDTDHNCGPNGIRRTLESAQNGADRHGPADITLLNEYGGGNTTFDPCGDTLNRFAAKLLNRSALRTLPDPEPLIDNVLDQGTVALLYGRWATFKSFIALDWAASVATGHPWQGRATEKRRVLYAAAEGAYGLKARMNAWETGWQTKIGDGDLDILPAAVNLTNPADVRDLTALIADTGYGFVIIDTLARCMVGADENSAKDCGQVVDTLTRLREHTLDGRGVVLGVHHTGKDGKTFRGSSVFEAGADTVYAVTRDGGVIDLAREKRKDGPEDDRHQLRPDPIPGTGSLVLKAHSDFDHPLVTDDRAEKILTIFRDHFGATGATRAQLRNTAVEIGVPSVTAYRGINDLEKSGQLVNLGSEQRPFYREGGKSC